MCHRISVAGAGGRSCNRWDAVFLPERYFRGAARFVSEPALCVSGHTPGSQYRLYYFSASSHGCCQRLRKPCLSQRGLWVHYLRPFLTSALPFLGTFPGEAGLLCVRWNTSAESFTAVGNRTLREEDDTGRDDEWNFNSLGVSDTSMEFRYGGLSRAGGYSYLPYEFISLIALLFAWLQRHVCTLRWLKSPHRKENKIFPLQEQVKIPAFPICNSMCCVWAEQRTAASGKSGAVEMSRQEDFTLQC